MADVSQGFAPVYDASSRVLILGSLPGETSIRDGRYYAHPRNAFWHVMNSVAELNPNDEYNDRCNALVTKRFALWDVLACAPRAGSLDAKIDWRNAVANDFEWLFETCQTLDTIVFNGRAAEKLYARFVTATPRQQCAQVTMPSTSPAYAAITADEKAKIWAERLASR